MGISAGRTHRHQRIGDVCTSEDESSTGTLPREVLPSWFIFKLKEVPRSAVEGVHVSQVQTSGGIASGHAHSTGWETVGIRKHKEFDSTLLSFTKSWKPMQHS